MSESGIGRVVAVKYNKSPSALAAAIRADGGSVRRQHIEHWLKAGKVPAEHVAAVHKAGGGLVSYADLNPDVDWDYLCRPMPAPAAGIQQAA